MSQVDNIAKKLKEFFKQKGLTQVQAAEMLGTTQQVVGKLLNGKPFGKRTAAHWHEVFGLNPSWLITGYGAMLEADNSQFESTTEKIVQDSASIVANEILRRISDGELFPASVVRAKDEVIAEKDREIQRLNRELGALRNELETREKNTLRSPMVSTEAEILAELNDK